MLKEMLIKGGAIIAATIVAEVVIEKLEKASLKRNRISEDEHESEEEAEKRRKRDLKMMEEIAEKHGFVKVGESHDFVTFRES